MTTKRAKCGQYDAPALEQWLAELAAEGLLLTDQWESFAEAEPQEARYCVEPAEEEGRPPDGLIERRAAAGWEYLCRTSNKLFDVWRASGAHTPPRPCATTEGWAYRRAGRALFGSWISVLLIPAGLAALYLGLMYGETFPVRRLMTDFGTQLNLALLVLSLLFSVPADMRDRRDLRALRRAIREGEHVAPRAAHTGFYTALRVLPIVFSVALLFAPLTDWAGERHMRELPELAVLQPFTHGDADSFDGSYHRSILGGGSWAYAEGGYAGSLDRGYHWSVSQTQLEVYAPRLRFLAPLLTEELRGKLLRDGCEAISLAGADEAWYSGDGTIQYLLLRDGGRVLLLRTDAPEDVRAHAGEFLAFLRKTA